MKKFFKKIGKGIKKLGKAIGKPFKKLFKSKIGKVLGTIGLMLIAPWMAQTVGSWFSGALATTTGTATGSAVSASASTAASTAAASGTAAAGSSAASSAAASKTFGNAIGDFFRNIGSKVKTTFNNITDGIKNIFTQGNTTTVENTVNGAKEASTKAMTEKGFNSGDFINTTKTTGTTGTTGTAKSLETTAFETTTGKTGIVGEEAASGKVITGGEVGETVTIKPKRIGEISTRPESSLLKPEGVDFTTDLSTPLDAPDLTLTDPKLPKVNTKQPGVVDRLASNVKDFWHGDTKYADLKEQTFRIQPLKNVEALPGFARKATVGEGVLLGQTIAANRMAEPYQAPSVDVSGAFAALSEVDTSGTGIDMIGSNVPSTMAMAQGGMDTTKWMNMTKKHNYIYDASQWG